MKGMKKQWIRQTCLLSRGGGGYSGGGDESRTSNTFFSGWNENPVEKIELTLLNGWKVLKDNAQPVAVKNGNFVNLCFGARGGITESYTPIFKLPEGFRPDRTITMVLLNENNLTWARLVAYTDGDVLLLNTKEITGAIVGVGGFPI